MAPDDYVPSRSALPHQPFPTTQATRAPAPEPRGARARLPRRSARPTLTVVLLSLGESAALGAAVAALQPQCAAASAELLIVRAGTTAEIAALSRAYPAAHIVPAPVGSSEEELRVLGMAEAGGDIVAFRSDRAAVAEGWIETYRLASALGAEDVNPGSPGVADVRLAE